MRAAFALVLTTVGATARADDTNAIEERGHAEVKADVQRCRPTTFAATAVLSLKEASAYNLARLVAEPQIETPAGISLRVIDLHVEPARVSYSDRVGSGVRVECRVELIVASDLAVPKYAAKVTLPHAHELSYWGGFVTPTFTFAGRPRAASANEVCPTASLPPNAAPAGTAPPERGGMFRAAWLMVRGFTKGEALAASIVLPIVTYLALKGSSRLSGFGVLGLVVTAIFTAMCAVLALVRLLFVWP